MKQTDLEKLLADMSLKEKVDQMLQLSGAFYLGDENSVLTGPANDMGIGKEDLEMAGSILGAAGADTMKKTAGRLYGKTAASHPDAVYDGCHSRHEDHFPGAAGAGSHF